MIYLLVLTHNRLPALKRLIDSVRPVLARPDTRLFVLAQASGGTYIVDHDDYRVFHHAENLGCAGGRQWLVDRLARELGPDDIVVFLDDDCYATNDTWLDALIGPIARGEADIAGVDGRIVDYEGLTYPALSRAIDYVSGGRMAVRALVFEYCAFDADFNPNYYEDVDFCRWAQLEDFRIVAVGDVGLEHEDHPGDPALVERNRRLLLEKWADQP